MRKVMFAVLVCACGGATSAKTPENAVDPKTAAGPIEGTVDGVSFALKDATMIPATAGFNIVAGNFDGACRLAQTNAAPVGDVVRIAVQRKTPPIAPGDYTVPTVDMKGMQFVSVDFASVDETGAISHKVTAKEGVVTINEVDGEHVAGSIDVRFIDGGLKGNFSVKRCVGAK